MVSEAPCTHQLQKILYQLSPLLSKPLPTGPPTIASITGQSNHPLLRFHIPTTYSPRLCHPNSARSNNLLDATSITKSLLTDIVPTEYHEILHFFRNLVAQKVSPHQPIDYLIIFVTNKQSPFCPLLGISSYQLAVLHQYLDKHLMNGFILSFFSSASAPILFVKKKNGLLQLWADWRALNAVTNKNTYPLLLINQTLDGLTDARSNTNMNLWGAYNLLRIHEGEEWKTALRTYNSFFEYFVMLLGLINVPVTCQNCQNDTFCEYLHLCCLVYLNNNLVQNNYEKLDVTHNHKVIMKSKEIRVVCKLQK